MQVTGYSKTKRMKYWIFDGSDVVGPLTPKELAARPDFVAVSLICPEYASQKAAGWRRASNFSEFHFEESTGKLQLISTPENEPDPKTLAMHKRLRKPARPSRAMLNGGIVRLSRNKRKANVLPPVHLAKGKDLDLSLPTQTPSVAPSEENETKPAQAATVKPVSATPKEDYSTQDMPIMPDKTGGELPPLPEGDGTRFFTTVIAQGDDLPEKDLFLTPDEESVPTEQPKAEPSAANTDENKPQDTPAEAPISTLSQIKPHLLPTPEIEEFLTDQQLAVVHPHRKNTKKILIVLLGLLLLPGIGYLVWRTVNHSSGPAVAAVKSLADEELALALTEPDGNVSGGASVATVPAPVTAADKALAAVQNYRLPGEQGTIASYFDRIYQERLSQGYEASWSVEPLHKSTYIVKYRLTKTRTEPLVYVFQADAARGQLTGALNNAALDLVGKN